MHTEYEVRVLEINVEDVKKKLEGIGAEFQWDSLQKRYVYDFIPRVDGKWIRLRTNGIKTTLTIKNLVSSEIDGTQELEIEVDNFERANLILKELGYDPKGYQENRRIQYVWNGVEIDIDSWPLIPTYLEVEGPSEGAVYNTIKALGFEKGDTTTRDVEGIYLDYGHDLKTIYDLKLEEERK
ncbi:MAG: CYTH domain-containing protein [Bacilli bacterium]|nr:CYTH domain-containing protein [Bacilli bacterium]